MRPFVPACAGFLTCLSALVPAAFAHAGAQSTDYPSLQAAIDANPAPRYRFALHRPARPDELRNIKIHGNIFHPGSSGVCNVELPPQ